MLPVYHKIKLTNGQSFTIKTDSLVNPNAEINLPKPDSSFVKLYQSKKEELDSLEKSIAKLKQQSDSLKNSIDQHIAKLRQLIYKARTPKDLEKIAKENSIPREK